MGKVRRLAERRGKTMARQVDRDYPEGWCEHIELAKQGPIVARLSWDDARQIYDIRAALESTAVADCARVADDKVKSRLRQALDELDRCSQQNSPSGILDATTEFYSTIFEASGHNIAWDVVSRLNGRISRLRVMTLSTANRTTSGPAQIRKIFTAIERNDPEAAAEACRAHVAVAAGIAQTLLQGTEPKS